MKQTDLVHAFGILLFTKRLLQNSRKDKKYLQKYWKAYDGYIFKYYKIDSFLRLKFHNNKVFFKCLEAA